MTRGASSRHRRAALFAPALLLVALSSCSSGGSTPVAPTATVTRGDITVGVTANGSFAAVTSENLGFATGGKLASVKAKVGDHVETGDVLATLDSRQAQHALEQAEANLAAQQAGLDRLASATTVSGAQSTVSQANTLVGATKAQAAATAEADQKAIDRAKAQLKTDKNARDDAEDALDELKSACKAASAAAQSGAADSALLAQAQKLLQAGDPTSVAEAQRILTQLGSQVGSAGTSDTTACSAVLTAQSGVSAAKQKVEADKTVLVAAEQKKNVDAASGTVAVESAKQGVVAAQNGLSSSSADRPHSIEQQQALVDAAQAGVDTAQKALDDTRLTAPSDGTITVVNGSKGEYVAPSTGTTAQAPGSRAAIPGSSTATSTTGATRPGGTQFMVLSDVDKVQLVLPFEQSDAALIKRGQAVTVQADALPGSALSGKVISVAPSSTVTSGAISYLVTVGLDELNSKLKDGQTARGTVIIQQRSNVLTVPNAAVRQQADASTVVVVSDDGHQQTVPFEAGVVGHDTTEVRSGLTEGQHVLLPIGAH